MSTRVAINGFGRVGRAAFRSAYERGADIDWVAINDLADAETLAANGSGNEALDALRKFVRTDDQDARAWFLLGRTSIQALANYDTPTVMGVIVFATVAIIVFNLIVDILYAWIDPRIRLA